MLSHGLEEMRRQFEAKIAAGEPFSADELAPFTTTLRVYQSEAFRMEAELEAMTSSNVSVPSLTFATGKLGAPS